MSKSEIKLDMPGVYRAQTQLYANGEWQTQVEKVPDPRTFEEYIFTGTAPSKRDPEKDEITCPVCSCAGKEQVLDDRIRIYHPTRLIPCRAPKGYELQGAEGDRLVPV